MSCPRYWIRFGITGTSAETFTFLGPALGQHKSLKPHIDTWTKWKLLAACVDDKCPDIDSLSEQHYTIKLGIRGTKMFSERVTDVSVGKHDDIKPYVDANIDWIEMAKEIDKKYGGELEIARVWNEQYCKAFRDNGHGEPLGGEHHWFPRDKQDEYMDHVKKKEQ